MYVACVFGTVNDRIRSSGTRGRGATDGKASAGLAKSSVNCEFCVQSTPAFTWHDRISNERNAENRLWDPVSPPGSAGIRVRSSALTWMRATCHHCLLGSSLTVTCFPATGEPSDAQFVDSVSSTSLSMLIPSPLAVALFADEARLRGMFTCRSLTI